VYLLLLLERQLFTLVEAVVEQLQPLELAVLEVLVAVVMAKVVAITALLVQPILVAAAAALVLIPPWVALAVLV
jgi:hypothetical protein